MQVQDDDGPRHPDYSWTTWYEGDPGPSQVAHMNITVDISNGPRPKKVFFRSAHTDPSTGRIDFRWFTLDKDCALPKMSVEGHDACPVMIVWFNHEIQPIEETDMGELVYQVHMSAPAEGWGGFFVELQFPGVSELFFDLDYTVTTQTFLVPTDKLPFPDCSGEKCEGRLV